MALPLNGGRQPRPRRYNGWYKPHPMYCSVTKRCEFRHTATPHTPKENTDR